MGIEDCFQIPAEKRTSFIEKNILAHLPEDVKDSARQRVTKIINAYVGQDLNALSVLAYAAEKGNFDEFVEKLEKHNQESLKYVHPEARTNAQVPGAIRAENFFLDCYKALNIKPNNN